MHKPDTSMQAAGRFEDIIIPHVKHVLQRKHDTLASATNSLQLDIAVNGIAGLLDGFLFAFRYHLATSFTPFIIF
jgi:hypothetical protein